MLCRALILALSVFGIALAVQGGRGARAMEGRLSEQGRYRVALAPAQPLEVHAWQRYMLRVERVDGTALPLRDLRVDGGMPLHGHGLPTAPRLRRGERPGELVVEGVRFNMAGAWELRVMIADEHGVDRAVFGFELGASSSAAPPPAPFSPSEWATIRSLTLRSLPALPRDASNGVADDPRAVALGHRLFFDRELSADGRVSCASCHQPDRLFSDGRALGRGSADLSRHTPSLVGAGYGSWFYWDGRRDSLWSQALQPMEAPHEMGSSRVDVLRHLESRPAYRSAYEALFGAMPSLRGVPRGASPVGNAKAKRAWGQLAADKQEEITRAFTHVGKAIAAYERRLRPGKSPFDDYVEALENNQPERARSVMSERAVAGLKQFVSPQLQCLRCHNGPLLTNGGFHNIGTSLSLPGSLPARTDFGRTLGIEVLLSSEFSCAGRYSDDPHKDCPELLFLNRHEQHGALDGAYKVPSLRNVAATGPYMHDGRYKTLSEVVDHYRHPGPESANIEFRPLSELPAGRIDAIVGFLESLTGPVDAPAELLVEPPPVARGRRVLADEVIPAPERPDAAGVDRPNGSARGEVPSPS